MIPEVKYRIFWVTAERRVICSQFTRTTNARNFAASLEYGHIFIMYHKDEEGWYITSSSCKDEVQQLIESVGVSEIRDPTDHIPQIALAC